MYIQGETLINLSYLILSYLINKCLSCLSILIKIGHTNLFAEIGKSINLQIAFQISKNSTIETDTTAQPLFWPSLRSISPLCTTCVDNDFWISGIVGILSE